MLFRSAAAPSAGMPCRICRKTCATICTGVCELGSLKPPLCKGRWQRVSADGWLVALREQVNVWAQSQSPAACGGAPLTQGGFWAAACRTIRDHSKSITPTSKAHPFRVRFFLSRIDYRTHSVGCIILAALDLAGQVDAGGVPQAKGRKIIEIGRASCRERA